MKNIQEKIKRLEELEKKGLFKQDEYSIYNPLNHPIGDLQKKMLLKEINLSVDFLKERIKEKE